MISEISASWPWYWEALESLQLESWWGFSSQNRQVFRDAIRSNGRKHSHVRIIERASRSLVWVCPVWRTNRWRNYRNQEREVPPFGPSSLLLEARSSWQPLKTPSADGHEEPTIKGGKGKITRGERVTDWCILTRDYGTEVRKDLCFTAPPSLRMYLLTDHENKKFDERVVAIVNSAHTTLSDTQFP